MVNKNLSAVIILVMVVIAVIIIGGNFFPTNQTTNPTLNNSSNTNSTSLNSSNTSLVTSTVSSDTNPLLSAQGRYVISLNSASEIPQNISQIRITIGSVRAYSLLEGWVTLNSNIQTFDLLQLKETGKNVLIADSNLSNDNYSQIGLVISSVIITDTKGTHLALIPSDFITLNTESTVSINSTTVTSIGIITNQSIYFTNKEEYVFAPKIQLLTVENAKVNISSTNNVTISSGTTKINSTLGMNEFGIMGEGLSVSPTTIFSIDEAGELVVE